MKAIVLLSGGLDSATTLAIARKEGFACHALTFRYGQRHSREIDAARRVARSLGAVEHRLIEIDLRALGGSALTDAQIDVPKDRASRGLRGDPLDLRARPEYDLPKLWSRLGGGAGRLRSVPRGQLDGLQWLSRLPAEFIAAFEAMANLATAAAVQGRGGTGFTRRS